MYVHGPALSADPCYTGEISRDIAVRKMYIYKEKKEKYLVHFSQIHNHTLCSMPGHHGSPISYECTHTSHKKTCTAAQ
jgi:hypothetical protein